MERECTMTEIKATADELETWENVSQGRVVIKKFSSRGDLIDEMIGGRRTFHVTTQERHFNQERAANDELDPFANGLLAPVRLLDSTEDAAEIAANPNLMSESEMGLLLKSSVKVIEKRMLEVRNPALVQRLHDMAIEGDCSIGKVTAIKARLAEIAPSLYAEVQLQGSDPAPTPPPSQMTRRG